MATTKETVVCRWFGTIAECRDNPCRHWRNINCLTVVHQLPDGWYQGVCNCGWTSHRPYPKEAQAEITCRVHLDA